MADAMVDRRATAWCRQQRGRPWKYYARHQRGLTGTTLRAVCTEHRSGGSIAELGELDRAEEREGWGEMEGHGGEELTGRACRNGGRR